LRFGRLAYDSKTPGEMLGLTNVRFTHESVSYLWTAPESVPQYSSQVLMPKEVQARCFADERHGKRVQAHAFRILNSVWAAVCTATTAGGAVVARPASI
jgi:hypothetical protein